MEMFHEVMWFCSLGSDGRRDHHRNGLKGKQALMIKCIWEVDSCESWHVACASLGTTQTLAASERSRGQCWSFLTSWTALTPEVMSRSSWPPTELRHWTLPWFAQVSLNTTCYNVFIHLSINPLSQFKSPYRLFMEWPVYKMFGLIFSLSGNMSCHICIVS